jgi:hypothetical protein
MRDDADLARLSGAWQAIAERPDIDVSKVMRRRRRQRVAFAAELAGGAIAFGATAFFWFGAKGPMLKVTALVMFITGLLAVGVALRQRATLALWADWTPRGVLAFRLRECDVALATARFGILSIGALLLFAAFFSGGAVLWQDTQVLAFHKLYAAYVIASCVAGGSWCVWRLRTIRTERARVLAIFEQFADEREAESVVRNADQASA